MNNRFGPPAPTPQNLTIMMLHELGVPAHRIGYKQLCAAIPCYARDDTQSLTKELYPSIARRFGYPNCGPVEHAIRLAILDGWERGRREVWEGYFPCALRPPSNKLFIATLAERLKQIDPQS